MNIIHVVAGLGGGTGTLVVELIKAQIRNGINVGLVYRGSIDECPEVKKIPNLSLYEATTLATFPGATLLFGVNYFPFYKDMKKKYKDEKIILHFHSPITIGLFGRRIPCSAICTLHTKLITRPYEKIIYNHILKRKVSFVGVSEDTTSFWKSINEKSNICTINNGIDYINTRHYRSHDSFTIGFVGYLTDAKGWKYVLEAYRQLIKYDSNYKIIIAGKGYHQEESRINEYLFSDEEVSNAEFLGFVSNAGEYVIPRFDIIVLPSISEGLPMSLLEALRAGVPMLATNVGGISNILHNGDTGFFINRDVDSIVQAIKLLKDDYALYQRMSENCLMLFEKEYSSKIMANRYYEIYIKA